MKLLEWNETNMKVQNKKNNFNLMVLMFNLQQIMTQPLLHIKKHLMCAVRGHLTAPNKSFSFKFIGCTFKEHT